jgi:hypothetical protein
MAEKQFTDIEKLQMLLTHWLQHNQSHGREYAKWASVARQTGHSKAAEYIEQAVDLLAKADMAFEKALSAVGGQGKEHRHHHHHD